MLGFWGKSEQKGAKDKILCIIMCCNEIDATVIFTPSLTDDLIEQIKVKLQEKAGTQKCELPLERSYERFSLQLPC